MKTHKREYPGSDLALCGVADKPGIAKRLALVVNENELVDCKTCLALMAKHCKSSDRSCAYHACMSDDCRYEVMKKQGFDVEKHRRHCDR